MIFEKDYWTNDFLKTYIIKQMITEQKDYWTNDYFT
jgi:hypothetical protein